MICLLLIALAGVTKSYSQTHAQSNSQTDPEAVESRGPSRGKLLLIGGAASEIFAEKFMELVGGPDAPIVVVPTAITSDTLSKEDLDRFRNSFIEEGFTRVTILHTRDRDVANSREFIKPIKKAKGIWFSGGRQWRHADSYLNTRTHKAFFELLDRGGVIAGSSAGATIQGSYLARGDTRKNTIMMGDHEEGLAFISNVAIDQHLFARNRQFDMFEILAHRPELLGIGLDEDTGIIVEGDRFTVFGNSYVAIYDGTRWSAERDTVYTLPPGSRDFYLLREGQKYNMRKRQIITE
jgi:cyanophycinase